MMVGGGVYQLVFELKEGREIKVGSLGRFSFPGGYYVYTGRAMRGLWRRLARHYRRRKRARWHIDYLLPHAELKAALITFTRDPRRECQSATKLLGVKGARVVAGGFGASDCRCQSHLVYLGKGPKGLRRALPWDAPGPPSES